MKTDIANNDAHEKLINGFIARCDFDKALLLKTKYQSSTNYIENILGIKRHAVIYYSEFEFIDYVFYSKEDRNNFAVSTQQLIAKIEGI
jgi:hypothetical protein